MPSYTEKPRLSDVLKSETQRSYHFEAATLVGTGAEQTVNIGTVLGRVTRGTASSAAKSGGNTGNGVMGTITVGAGAMAGVYALRIVEAITNAGQFELRDPNGVVVGVGLVAAAFASTHLSFTLADGATDFIVGDGFDITVAAGSGKVAPLDLTAVTGAEDVYGVMAENIVTAASTDAACRVLVRGPGILMESGLIYPAGASAPQKAAIQAALTALNLVVRTGA